MLARYYKYYDVTSDYFRCQLLLILLANCQMRLENYDAAVSYWSQLLSMTIEIERSADINMSIARCYSAVEEDMSAHEAATKALGLYRELPKGHRERARKIKEVRELMEKMDE